MLHRIGIGKIWHESNSFFALPTTLQNFESFPEGLLVGPPLLGQRERSDEITGMLDRFRRTSTMELVPLLGAAAEPSGPVSQDCTNSLTELLRTQLRAAGRLDGVCFALHGAMTGESIADLEGHFLRVIRDEVGPEIPVVCSLDCHATVTHEMVQLSTALTAYRTHPHSDIVETGNRAAGILLDALAQKTKPVMRMQKVPVLIPDRGTLSSPVDRLFQKFIDWDALEGVIAGSLCPSYPFQDVPGQGWAVIAVTDDDRALAERLVAELAEDIWSARHELMPTPMLSPRDALLKAIDMPGRPILVTDSADNVGAGAAGDSTAILSALLESHAATDAMVLANLTDVQTEEIAATHSVGETVTLHVAGKSDPRYGKPIPVTAEILSIEKGPITDDGNFSGNPTLDVGAIVCLGIANLRLVLTQHPVWGPQPSLFRKVGIEPFEAKLVVVKSGIGYKVTYGNVARAVVDADCPGPGSRNVNHFDYRNIPRPIFPLDEDAQFNIDVHETLC